MALIMNGRYLGKSYTNTNLCKENVLPTNKTSNTSFPRSSGFNSESDAKYMDLNVIVNLSATELKKLIKKDIAVLSPPLVEKYKLISPSACSNFSTKLFTDSVDISCLK